MRHHLKKYLIPHRENDFKPHVFRGISVLVIALVALFLFGLTVFQAALLRRNADYTAAVLPAVLVDLANADRVASGKSPLAVNPLLEEAARRKAEDMAARGYFAHVSPEGLTPWYWMYLSGYNFVYAGENLAVNFIDSADVEYAWMNSPSHRSNIINNYFTEIGIAAISGTWNGKPTIFVVQMFGAPLSSPRVAGETVTLESRTSVPEASATEESVSPATLETVAIDDTFIAVKNEDVDVSVAPSEPDEPAIVNAPVVQQSTFAERLFVAPRATLRMIYTVLGVLLLIALGLMIFIEVKTQHPKNIVYAVLLILFIVGLSYFHYRLLSGGVTIL